MESAFETVLNVFKGHSHLFEGFYKIQQAELVNMINLEFVHWVKGTKDPNAVQQIIQDLEEHPDCVITFGKCMDYLVWLATVTQDQIER